MRAKQRPTLFERFFFSQDGKLPAIQETQLLTYFNSPVGSGRESKKVRCEKNA